MSPVLVSCAQYSTTSLPPGQSLHVQYLLLNMNELIKTYKSSRLSFISATLSCGLALLTLHYPHLELDEAVGEEAEILSLAAVAHRVPTQIQLVLRMVLANFGVL